MGTALRFLLAVVGVGLFSIVTVATLVVVGMRAEKKRAAEERARRAAEESNISTEE